MNRRKKYRLFLMCFLVLDLLVMAFLGYQYLNRKIPDEIQVSRQNSTDVSELLSNPFVTFDEAVPVSGDGGYVLPCRLLGYLPFKEVKVTPVDDREVYVSGNTIGIYMETKGVLVIDTGEIQAEDGETKEPSRNIVRPGDYIVAFNDQKVTDKKELIRDLENMNGEAVTLKVNRDGETLPVSVTPAKDASGSYSALGHGISDIDTADLLEISGGALYKAQVLAVNKGSKGNPGELAGLIRYEERNLLGTITENNKNGIYGQLYTNEENSISLRKMPVAHKQEVRTGDATILACVDGQVKEYAAEIKRIDLNHEDTNKSFVIQITDENLLELTGGVVQGMSGSPILQDGKVVGAVTHVFVQDSTSGYGIFIENMLNHEK